MVLDCKADSLMDLWSDWCTKLLEFSKVESDHRPLVKKVLQRLDSSDIACPEGSIVICARNNNQSLAIFQPTSMFGEQNPF